MSTACILSAYYLIFSSENSCGVTLVAVENKPVLEGLVFGAKGAKTTFNSGGHHSLVFPRNPINNH